MQSRECVYRLVFFFKQKTAYEMRISDWSSDVCSSDLEATPQEDSRVVSFPNRFGSEDPAAAAARAQIRGLLEHAIDELPEAFRLVFVMREIAGCPVEETATTLGIRPETVKTRLYRARRVRQDGGSVKSGFVRVDLGARRRI